jgi:hypothetical protein
MTSTFLELENAADDFRWPRKGDRLIRRSENWEAAAEFSENANSRHVHIWTGFTSAGAALIAQCEREPLDRHFLIYPILFNYRHGLELAMKWTLRTHGTPSSLPDDLGHDLLKLWRLCRALIETVVSKDDAKTIPIVEKIVEEFHRLDKSGTAFRYSTDKNGDAIKLPAHLIDLQNLRDVMKAIDNYFSGVDGQFSDMCRFDSL